MIAFTRLGSYGLLGNQLFQYAYVRTMARRLGVPFYCPPWEGDRVFALDDGAERAAAAGELRSRYVQEPRNCGWSPSAATVPDGTDVLGFFQSERYFDDPEAVRRWYRLTAPLERTVEEKARRLGVDEAVGLHVRLGDKTRPPNSLVGVSAPPAYYRRALARLGAGRVPLVVFSDDPAGARRRLGEVGAGASFVAGNADYEDLHLMARCRHLVCAPSTLSWWGAWLGERPGRVVVAPREWLRPGCGVACRDVTCARWIELPTRRVRDHYVWQALRHPYWAAWFAAEHGGSSAAAFRAARAVVRRLSGRRSGPRAPGES